MKELEIYNKLKTPPKEALKPIKAGRLKGKTDISPQWRIQVMTEAFGPCGIGWKFEITKQWTEPADSGQIFAFVNINLYIKDGDNWSDAIPGTGGTLLIVNEKNGLYSNDEAYKMSLTDALGMAMKCLGVAADVYMGLLDSGGNNDSSKYQSSNQGNQTNFETRELTSTEVKEKWNGKIYKGDIVYIDNKKVQPPKDQVDRLKNHEKYKPDAAK
jgi:hypothetical protein